MDLAWIAPPSVLIGGAFGVALLSRRIAAALDQVAGSARRFRRLEDAMIPIRVETRRARTSIDRLPRR